MSPFALLCMRMILVVGLGLLLPQKLQADSSSSGGPSTVSSRQFLSNATKVVVLQHVHISQITASNTAGDPIGRSNECAFTGLCTVPCQLSHPARALMLVHTLRKLRWGLPFDKVETQSDAFVGHDTWSVLRESHGSPSLLIPKAAFGRRAKGDSGQLSTGID